MATRLQPPRLPAMALLEGEVLHFEDGSSYGLLLSTQSATASRNIDLLLGTQVCGWCLRVLVLYYDTALEVVIGFFLCDGRAGEGLCSIALQLFLTEGRTKSLLVRDVFLSCFVCAFVVPLHDVFLFACSRVRGVETATEGCEGEALHRSGHPKESSVLRRCKRACECVSVLLFRM